jgi:hypothetical protein
MMAGAVSKTIASCIAYPHGKWHLSRSVLFTSYFSGFGLHYWVSIPGRDTTLLFTNTNILTFGTHPAS